MTWKTDSNSHPEASLFDDLFSLCFTDTVLTSVPTAL